MAVQTKNSSNKTSLYLLLVLVAGVILFAVFSSKSKLPAGQITGSPTPVSKVSPKPAGSQNSTQPQSSVSGPVGRNGLRAYAGPGVGEVTLEWQRFAIDGENYSVHYGIKSNVYPYLANHVGYISTYTVKNLTPGTKYYFVVEGFRSGNTSAGWDGEVSAVAPKSAVTVVVTAGPIGRNQLVVKAGPKKGQVSLNWIRFFPDTEKYNVVYGIKPGVYSYGLLNAVDTTPQDNQYSYIISSLQSGTRYYFALIPQRSGNGTYVTSEVSIVAP